jgi:uncharacterized phiE125 gp8 family phage protein
MPLVLVTPPAVEPITLAEAKQYLRVDHSDDDAEISALISAAREYLQGRTNVALVEQVWDLVLDEFPLNTGAVCVPLTPVQSVDSIKYDDEEGVEQTLSSDSFVLDAASKPPWIALAQDVVWPTTLQTVNGVRVRMTFGFPPDEGSPPDYTANIPPSMIVPLKMLVSHWYDHRGVVSVENLSEVPAALNALINLNRMYV